MKMIVFGLLFTLSTLSYGQEVEQYVIDWKIETPSLSIVSASITSSIFELLEVDLDQDLRRQGLRKEQPILLVEQQPKPVRKYNFTIGGSKPKPSSFSITGSGSNLNNPNNAGIRNSAYQDMSRYSRIYYRRSPNVFYYR
ncbi:hypothetical protein ACE939_06920 [Aquimarina sp. W85]|uniref:hypothetical protein n=1 Tax=Aquimarina rhodophyticola TaxID=3342246 RepID=UPI00366C9DEF